MTVFILGLKSVSHMRGSQERKEEARSIKQSLNLPELDVFKASEGWLDKWKLSHGIKEKQISSESLDVSQTTVESWMEQIKELCKG